MFYRIIRVGLKRKQKFYYTEAGLWVKNQLCAKTFKNYYEAQALLCALKIIWPRKMFIEEFLITDSR